MASLPPPSSAFTGVKRQVNITSRDFLTTSHERKATDMSDSSGDSRTTLLSSLKSETQEQIVEALAARDIPLLTQLIESLPGTGPLASLFPPPLPVTR